LRVNSYKSLILIIYISETEKLRHPYYKIIELKGVGLTSQLNSWSRVELIEWFCWNDRNGIYKDDESLEEFGNTVSKEEAIEIITRQITEV
jgi:hypothetical protein